MIKKRREKTSKQKKSTLLQSVLVAGCVGLLLVMVSPVYAGPSYDDVYKLTTHVDGCGSVVVNPVYNWYPDGLYVNLHAIPSDGWLFYQWSGDFSGTNTDIVVVMDQDMDITAHFSKIEQSEIKITRSHIPANILPIADSSAGAPYAGVIGEAIRFNASLSYDPDGFLIGWIWQFGDGIVADNVVIDHVYEKPGEYQVKLTVVDNRGGTNTQTFITEIEPHNLAPSEPIIIGPTVGVKNTEYIFAVVAYDDDNDPIQYLIEWGDGHFSESDVLPEGVPFIVPHTWESSGTFIIQASVDDGEAISIKTLDFKIKDSLIPIDFNILLLLIAAIAIILVFVTFWLARHRI